MEIKKLKIAPKTLDLPNFWFTISYPHVWQRIRPHLSSNPVMVCAFGDAVKRPRYKVVEKKFLKLFKHKKTIRTTPWAKRADFLIITADQDGRQARETLPIVVKPQVVEDFPNAELIAHPNIIGHKDGLNMIFMGLERLNEALNGKDPEAIRIVKSAVLVEGCEEDLQELKDGSN